MRVDSDGHAPESIAELRMTSAVTGVQCGKVSSLTTDDLVVSTYAGGVVGMACQPAYSSDGDGAIGQTEASVAALSGELEALQLKLAAERASYEKRGNNGSDDDATDRKIGAVRAPKIAINDSFKLDPIDSSHIMTLELPTSIDTVMLQCNIPVDVVDVDETKAAVSLSSCNDSDGSQFLATVTCNPGITHLQVKLRSIEGQTGTLQAYVIPQMLPKACVVRRYILPALSTHRRTSEPLDPSVPVNTLTLKGSFNVHEMHSWLGNCLASVPSRMARADGNTMTYISTLLGTKLECEYSDGLAVFRTDNLTTASIVRDVLAAEATSNNVAITIASEVDDDSVIRTLNLFFPKLEAQLALSRKLSLVEPLRELAAHEPDCSHLTTEMAEILASADDLSARQKKDPALIDRLIGMVVDLYIDYFKFMGEDVKNKAHLLIEALGSGASREVILDMFKRK